MKSRERKQSVVRRGPARPTEETAIAELDKVVPRGQSLGEMLAELERSHPDLATESPISSAAVEAGELVRSARLAAGKSQRDLAKASGLHQSAVSAVERGEGKEGPSFRKLRDIADALGLRLAFVQKEEGVALVSSLESRSLQAIRRLSPEQAQLLHLSYDENKSDEEIAHELSLPLHTVKSRLRVAIVRLRSALTEA